MGVVAITFIMKLQGTILILAVLICQLQCAPKGCRGCEWDNTGHSNGHTTGQATGKRSGVINVFKKSDDGNGNPDDTDSLLPQNWWESKKPMGDGAASVKRDGADPRGCRGCEWDDTENQPPNDQEKTKRDNNPADTDAIVPTGPTNGQEGDGTINVKRGWDDSENPSGPDGPPPIDGANEPRFYPCKGPYCVGDQGWGKRSANNPADTDAIIPTGPTNGKEGDGVINVKRSIGDNSQCEGPYCTGDRGEPIPNPNYGK